MKTKAKRKLHTLVMRIYGLHASVFFIAKPSMPDMPMPGCQRVPIHHHRTAGHAISIRHAISVVSMDFAKLNRYKARKNVCCREEPECLRSSVICCLRGKRHQGLP